RRSPKGMKVELSGLGRVEPDCSREPIEGGYYDAKAIAGSVLVPRARRGAFQQVSIRAGCDPPVEMSGDSAASGRSHRLEIHPFRLHDSGCDCLRIVRIDPQAAAMFPHNEVDLAVRFDGRQEWTAGSHDPVHLAR